MSDDPSPDVTDAPPTAAPRAAPPITIGPFTNVPAPGSPIRSDWPQQISQYVVDKTSIRAEWRHVATSIPAGSFMSTTPWDMQDCAMGVRAFPRVVIVNAGILFAVSAGAETLFDFYLRPKTAGVLGATVRSRVGLLGGAQVGGRVSAFYIVPANVDATFNSRFGAASGSATGGTLGAGDLNYVQAVALPMTADPFNLP